MLWLHGASFLRGVRLDFVNPRYTRKVDYILECQAVLQLLRDYVEHRQRWAFDVNAVREFKQGSFDEPDLILDVAQAGDVFIRRLS